MTTPDEPQFPFQIVWLETGEIESYDDPKDLLCNLEEFDSDDTAYPNKARVTDFLGRRVHLVVRIWENRCEFKLEHPKNDNS